MLTIGQAAHRLALSVAWVRHLADAGTLDCTRSPLGRLITTESVERYRAERERTHDDRTDNVPRRTGDPLRPPEA